MTRIHTDLSRVPVSVAPSPATSGTTLGVSDANAALLPDTYPYWAVLVPVNVAPTRSNSEIVKVTAGSSSGGTTTLTIVRAQGVPVTTAQTVTTSFDIYDANSAEALPQVSSSVTEVPSGTINGSNTTFTLSSTPTSGTVKLYQNGVRLKLTEDYTISGVTITMNTAPVTGDLLLADYSINSGTFSVGSNSFIDNETPSGTVDGSNVTFTLAFTPVTGTLHLFRDGQEIYATNDYTLSGITITMVAAPVTGTVLKANYQKSVSVAGNADTLDGFHANDYGGTDGQLVTDYGGWKKINSTLTYASATTINSSADLTGVLQKGDKIKLTNSTVKYFYVVSITASVITVTGGSDYTVANAAITLPYFSKESSPQGFPQWFNWTPTINTGNAVLSGYTKALFKIEGLNLFYKFSAENKSLSGTAGVIKVSIPVTPNVTNCATEGFFGDLGAYYISGYALIRHVIDTGNGVFTVQKGLTAENWAANETGLYLFLKGSYAI